MLVISELIGKSPIAPSTQLPNTETASLNDCVRTLSDKAGFLDDLFILISGHADGKDPARERSSVGYKHLFETGRVLIVKQMKLVDLIGKIVGTGFAVPRAGLIFDELISLASREGGKN